ncbi:hypothetical protein [Nocardia puris]|uniref:Uncharacterized protein n=1 Tax=Nocardia puris TaxID=208602 RepID=A0A366D5Q7_9NOCA|nr:hypothetical protein [Nocardia puris]RBO85285.1 hypothetical protein DFR74_115133 [Nocardia puris]
MAADSRGDRYMVPTTDERAALIAEFAREFAYSASAYALLGAEHETAAVLAEQSPPSA